MTWNEVTGHSILSVWGQHFWTLLVYMKRWEKMGHAFCQSIQTRICLWEYTLSNPHLFSGWDIRWSRLGKPSKLGSTPLKGNDRDAWKAIWEPCGPLETHWYGLGSIPKNVSSRLRYWLIECPLVKIFAAVRTKHWKQLILRAIAVGVTSSSHCLTQTYLRKSISRLLKYWNIEHWVQHLFASHFNLCKGR